MTCFISPGNDDGPTIDSVSEVSDVVVISEERVVEVDAHHEMVSEEFSNVTPWAYSRGKEAVQIGRTLCMNPGSEYTRGILQGAMVNLDEKTVKSYLLTSG